MAGVQGHHRDPSENTDAGERGPSHPASACLGVDLETGSPVWTWWHVRERPTASPDKWRLVCALHMLVCYLIIGYSYKGPATLGRTLTGGLRQVFPKCWGAFSVDESHRDHRGQGTRGLVWPARPRWHFSVPRTQALSLTPSPMVYTCCTVSSCPQGGEGPVNECVSKRLPAYVPGHRAVGSGCHWLPCRESREVGPRARAGQHTPWAVPRHMRVQAAVLVCVCQGPSCQPPV